MTPWMRSRSALGTGRCTGYWTPTSRDSLGSSPWACFDNISHDRMMRFVEARVAPNSWLAEGGRGGGRQETTGDEGHPATCRRRAARATCRRRAARATGRHLVPRLRRGMRLLANIYLHYTYDLWTEQWRGR